MKIEDLFKQLKKSTEGASFEAQSVIVMATYASLLGLHIRALACHCECLGMNAENAMAVCGDYQPPYNQASYESVMRKWDLIGNEGEPLI